MRKKGFPHNQNGTTMSKAATDVSDDDDDESRGKSNHHAHKHKQIIFRRTHFW